MLLTSHVLVMIPVKFKSAHMINVKSATVFPIYTKFSYSIDHSTLGIIMNQISSLTTLLYKKININNLIVASHL